MSASSAPLLVDEPRRTMRLGEMLIERGQIEQGDLDRAMAEFSILLERHPDYTAGYFMAAQALARAERAADAKKMLQDGIASARRTGNLHAQSEMEAMLTELG